MAFRTDLPLINGRCVLSLLLRGFLGLSGLINGVVHVSLIASSCRVLSSCIDFLASQLGLMVDAVAIILP